MVQFQQPAEATTGSRVSTNAERLEDLFWQQGNVEETIRKILSEFAGELQMMKRLREA